MQTLGWSLIAVSVLLLAYTYVGYPLLLTLLRRRSSGWAPSAASATDLPTVSITVPVFNEEAQLPGLIRSLLRMDYPPEKRQILIISDGSSDQSVDIAQSYASEGIEVLALTERCGKTAAENAAIPHLRGEIIVNTDASTRFAPGSLLALVEPFCDESVGVVSGRDLSVGPAQSDSNSGEAGYVGYEMWVRRLESCVDGIVGASGCFYAVRAELHKRYLAEAVARDFAAPLMAREAGLRAVSAENAVCMVRRTTLRREYHRKVRTVAGGMGTLLQFARLMNPARYERFAWMLFSHKVCRWLASVAVLAAVLAVFLLGASDPWARYLAAGALLSLLLALAGWFWPAGRALPAVVAVPAYIVTSNLAVVHAWMRLARGRLDATWEPTPREADDVASPRV